jgi:hypothetical protein
MQPTTLVKHLVLSIAIFSMGLVPSASVASHDGGNIIGPTFNNPGLPCDPIDGDSQVLEEAAQTEDLPPDQEALRRQFVFLKDEPVFDSIVVRNTHESLIWTVYLQTLAPSLWFPDPLPINHTVMPPLSSVNLIGGLFLPNDRRTGNGKLNIHAVAVNSIGECSPSPPFLARGCGGVAHVDVCPFEIIRTQPLFQIDGFRGAEPIQGSADACLEMQTLSFATDSESSQSYGRRLFLNGVDATVTEDTADHGTLSVATLHPRNGGRLELRYRGIDCANHPGEERRLPLDLSRIRGRIGDDDVEFNPPAETFLVEFLQALTDVEVSVEVDGCSGSGRISSAGTLSIPFSELDCGSLDPRLVDEARFLIDFIDAPGPAVAPVELAAIETGFEPVDTDADGLSDEFEALFGGLGIDIVNPASSPPDTGSYVLPEEARGSVDASDPILGTGPVRIVLPRDAAATDENTTIRIEYVPDGTGTGVNPGIAISGLELGTGTKAITIPAGDQNAICIDDRPDATVDAAAQGACTGQKVEVPIPPVLGETNEVGPVITADGVETSYRVTRVAEFPVFIEIEGLVHSAFSTILDTDLDTVPDDFDPCPEDAGTSSNAGCPPIAIDVKPDSDRNSVNPRAKGVISVAILGSPDFDVEEVDRATLAFGPSDAAPTHKKGGHLQDVDGDSFTDLLSHYDIRESGIAAGAVEVCVVGRTLEGTGFRGCDSITSVAR